MNDRPDPFTYGGLTLDEAIDALSAYDGGARDSGIKDEGMREAVRRHLASLDEVAYRRACLSYGRRFLSDEGLARGYGLADLLAFVDWLEEMGLPRP